MKVIDAVWEKRNLGVDTVEFVVDGSENINEIKSIILSSERDYNVVKCPTGIFELNCVLAEMGYTYVESMVKISFNLKTISATPILKRICESISYARMNDNDLDELFFEINKGIFKTDRIALDPHFSVEIANKRYINWIKDEIQKGAEVFKIMYKNNNISFFTYKKIAPNTYYPFLFGIYENYVNSGLGVPCSMKTIEECIKRNGRNISYVSTNNHNSLTANLMAGYNPVDVSNVFIKHHL